MKHIFIINPKAGRGEAYKNILPVLIKHSKKFNVDFKVHITSEKGDAEKFTEKICALNRGKHILRFYACGGDGTLNEVVNGAYGHKNIEIACIPSGTGNDFVKNFKGNFKNLIAQIKGKSVYVDILECRINGKKKYAINLINMGLDCDVVKYMEAMKESRLRLLNGIGLYMYGVMRAFVDMKSIDIEMDSDLIAYKGKATLLAFGNGSTYGGGFKATPYSIVNDSYMDICLVKEIGRADFIRLIGEYKNGFHVNEKNKNVVSYAKSKKARVRSNEKITISFDGELAESNEVEVRLIPKAIKFVLPSNIKLLRTKEIESVKYKSCKIKDSRYL